MSKQDRQGARTPSDLEQKYNFSKTFAEIMGIANDARDLAQEAKNLYDGMSQEEIFNLLTNNGEWQGIYEEDGGIYLNASYIKAGTLAAEHIDVKGIIEAEEFIVDLAKVTGTLTAEYIDANGAEIGGFTVSEDELSATSVYTNEALNVSGLETTSIKPADIKTEATYVYDNNTVITRTELTAGGIVKTFLDERDDIDITLMDVYINGERYNVYLNKDVDPPRIEVIKVPYVGV